MNNTNTLFKLDCNFDQDDEMPSDEEYGWFVDTSLDSEENKIENSEYSQDNSKTPNNQIDKYNIFSQTWILLKNCIEIWQI